MKINPFIRLTTAVVTSVALFLTSCDKDDDVTRPTNTITDVVLITPVTVY